jgi:hypothetical protein
MRLVYANDLNKEVKVGDVVHISGKPHYVVFFRKPHSPASSGKIVVASMDERKFQSEYFVGVAGAVWIEREDRL